MKRMKLLMPLAVATTAITPVIMLTGCSGARVTLITDKEISSGDSLTSYKFKMAVIPSDKKVTVNVINNTESQEQVYLYQPYSTSNGKLSTLTLDVSDNGEVEVPAGYYLAPSQSANSTFGLTFTYKDGNNEVTDKVEGLKFNYNVDYGAELKDGNYPAYENAPDKAHFGDKIGETYMKDVLATPAIFQNDARYSTSLNIKKAIGEKFKVNSFKAYFNDIVKQDDGLHLHMNYEIKGGSDSIFTFDAKVAKFTFTNFNFSFTFETHDGYEITETEPTNAEYRTLYIKDATNNYYLDGRFQGTFTVKVDDEATGKTIEYNDLIDNYTIFPTTNNHTYTDAELASFLAFGIIHLTYDFEWGTGKAPVLKLNSTYARNTAA